MQPTRTQLHKALSPPANSAPCMDEPVRSLSVRARDARHWAGMQRDRPKPRTGHRRAFFIRVINGGATGGCPRRNIRSVDLVRLFRSLAYQRVPRMACEADVIRIARNFRTRVCLRCEAT